MGNDKYYGLQGTLVNRHVDISHEEIRDAFHATYCTVTFDPEGYLAQGRPGELWLQAAIHSYSLAGNAGPGILAPKFAEMTCWAIDTEQEYVFVWHWNGESMSVSRTELAAFDPLNPAHFRAEGLQLPKPPEFPVVERETVPEQFAFMHHYRTCKHCRYNPFALCEDGRRLLAAAQATADPSDKSTPK